MAVFLGLDGGGTGCRAAACDGAGRILGRGTAGPANIASDPEAACANILAAAEAALGGRVPDVAVLGLAGANLPAMAERLRAALPYAEVRVESDALTALKGAFQDGDGVVAALGTGSVFTAQRGGAVRMIGGWGLELGDEASGAWIARACLARILRAADGYFPTTPLIRALCAELGGPDAIVTFVKSASPADIAAFAPRIIAAAKDGDMAAQAVLAAADAEIIAAITLLRGENPLPVAFVGGLAATFAARLAGRWPVVQARGSGLDGALWMARHGRR